MDGRVPKEQGCVRGGTFITNTSMPIDFSGLWGGVVVLVA